MAFPLVLVSSPVNFAGEHEMIESMLESGLTCLHLRKPGLSASELERWLLALDAAGRSRVVLHGEPELASSMDLMGCHISWDAVQTAVYRREEHGSVGLWSTSLHSFEELRSIPSGVSRCFLSPIFDSISKMGYLSAFTPTDIREGLFMARARSESIPQVFALGGIDSETLPLACEYGFDGAAVLGAVWNAPDPVGACQELLHVARDLYD